MPEFDTKEGTVVINVGDIVVNPCEIGAAKKTKWIVEGFIGNLVYLRRANRREFKRVLACCLEHYGGMTGASLGC